MINLENSVFLKLKEDHSYEEKVEVLLLNGERVLGSYNSSKVGIVFTSLRIIVLNVQGMRGKKVDFTSLPYREINHYSIEVSGSFEKDVSLDLAVGGLGKLRFEFKGNSNIIEIVRYISEIIMVT